MIIVQPIEILKKYPGETEVIVNSYEYGYDSVTNEVEEQIKRNLAGLGYEL